MAVEAPSVPRRAPLRFPRRRPAFLTTAGLLAPPVLWLVVFFLVPVVLVAMFSVGLLTLFPGPTSFSLDDWRYFLNAEDRLSLFWKSIKVSGVVSVVCVVLAYPIAYFLALSAGKRKYIFLLLIVIPFFTSFLLRVAAWKFILGDQGLVNTLFYETGLRNPDHPIPGLVYSQFTVGLVLLYVYIPFVALPIFVALENLDRRLLEAASDLGASRWQAFRRITLPLSLPGVIAAFVFIFIPTIGEYVTPSLVGGTDGFLFGNAIADAFGQNLDWELGSVLALFLFLVVLAFMLVFARFLTLRRVAG